jgi:hypothetical protein
MRFYFYATERDDGQWELHSSLTSQPTAYPNREAALLAAKQNCRRHWEVHGTACGVRVRTQDGSWIDEHLEGDLGPHPEVEPAVMDRVVGKLLRDRRRKA